MGTGTVELVGDLGANLATLQAEGHDVSVDRNVCSTNTQLMLAHHTARCADLANTW